jgi:phosphoribosylformylglycinamidine synthase subunit PurS
MYKANITITLRSSILDPQGKAALHALGELGFKSVQSVRIGKVVEMEIDSDSLAAANQIAEKACKELLANSVMEDYHIELHELVSS